MAATIYSREPAPWKVGGKTVETFPSGLVKVDQVYAVPTATATDYIETFEVGATIDLPSPATDGLYIYPQPSWEDQGNGFTHFNVQAYGRSRLDAQDVATIQRDIGGIAYSEAGGQIGVAAKCFDLSFTVCKEFGETADFDDLTVDDELYLPSSYYVTNDTGVFASATNSLFLLTDKVRIDTISAVFLVAGVEYTWSFGLRRRSTVEQSRRFGNFIECDVLIETG